MLPLQFPTPTPLTNASPAAPQAVPGKSAQGKGFDEAMQQALGESPRDSAPTATSREASPTREKKKAVAPEEASTDALLAGIMAGPPPSVAPTPAPSPQCDGEATDGATLAIASGLAHTTAFAPAEETSPEETSATATTTGETAETDPLPEPAATRTATTKLSSADPLSTHADTELSAVEETEAPLAAATPITAKADAFPAEKLPLPAPPALPPGSLQTSPAKADAKAGQVQLTADFAPVARNPEMEQAMAEAMKNLPPATAEAEAEAAKSDLSDWGDDKTPVNAQDGASGISAAQQVIAMKKNGQSSQNPSQGEQNLPGTVVDAAADTTSFRAPRPARLAGNIEFQSTPHFLPGLEMSKAELPTAVPLVAVPAATAALAQLESTQEMVANHALRLRQSEDGSMQVVIKPAEGLELSLHLKQVAGTVEVQAQLNQGDAEFMGRHWKQLQEQLEGRGIRLAPLTTEQNLTNGNPTGSRQEAPAKEAQRLASEDAVPAARRSFAGANASTVSRNQPQPVRTTAWEYWA